MDLSWWDRVPPSLSSRSCRWISRLRSKSVSCNPGPVNSIVQEAANEFSVTCQVAAPKRTDWFASALAEIVTGSGEINGTKYINDATGLVDTPFWSCPSQSVGPEAAPALQTVAMTASSAQARPFR